MSTRSSRKRSRRQNSNHYRKRRRHDSRSRYSRNYGSINANSMSNANIVQGSQRNSYTYNYQYQQQNNYTFTDLMSRCQWIVTWSICIIVVVMFNNNETVDAVKEAIASLTISQFLRQEWASPRDAERVCERVYGKLQNKIEIFRAIAGVSDFGQTLDAITQFTSDVFSASSVESCHVYFLSALCGPVGTPGSQAVRLALIKHIDLFDGKIRDSDWRQFEKKLKQQGFFHQYDFVSQLNYLQDDFHLKARYLGRRAHGIDLVAQYNEYAVDKFYKQIKMHTDSIYDVNRSGDFVCSVCSTSNHDVIIKKCRDVPTQLDVFSRHEAGRTHQQREEY